MDEEPARKRSVTSIRIRGLAERAGSPELPLGPDVIVPEQVPLRVEFSVKETIGLAALRRDEQGIWAEAEIHLDTWEHLEGMRFRHPAEMWPKLAVGILKPLTENGVITSGKVVSVSLVRENADTALPPWEVATDPPGECGICGSALEYRDRFLKRDGRWTQDKVPGPWCPHCEDDLEHLYQFTHELKFCGCGDPESVYNLVRDLLGLIEERWEKDKEPQDPIARAAAIGEEIKSGNARWDWAEWNQRFRDRIGGGDGTYYAIMYWLDGSALIEHGGSVGGSWLTLKGKHYLSLMRLHIWDDVDEVGLPHEGQGCGPGCRHWEASTEDYVKDQIKREATA